MAKALTYYACPVACSLTGRTNDGNKKMPTAQQRFDHLYVCSVEIKRRVGITSSGLTLAQQRGKFPRPTVNVGRIVMLWERAVIEPLLNEIEAARV